MSPKATLNPDQGAHVLYLLCRSNHPLFTNAIFSPTEKKQAGSKSYSEKRMTHMSCFYSLLTPNVCASNQFSNSQDTNWMSTDSGGFQH